MLLPAGPVVSTRTGPLVSPVGTATFAVRKLGMLSILMLAPATMSSGRSAGVALSRCNLAEPSTENGDDACQSNTIGDFVSAWSSKGFFF